VAVLFAGAAAVSVVGAAAALGHVAPTGGGAIAPGSPQVASVQCVTRCIGPSTGVVKSKIRLLGADLANTTVVSLPRANGTRAKDKNPIVKPNGAVLAFVGPGAVTGPVRLGDTFGQFHESSAPLTVGTLEELKAVQMQYRFPVQGAHDFGDAMARFGAPRNGHIHQGQDVFAPCGTPLVAPHSGIVQSRGYQASAGNYVVIDGAGVAEDYVLMHLKGAAKAAKKQSVTTGQFIGRVGQTGNASGCHLHFEVWPGKGWYSGGSPIDPLGLLQYWDSFS
jgi:murein DD-endopeptidase MepM/ murein hydrolase activator NlpD